jgi:hypothetical protein
MGFPKNLNANAKETENGTILYEDNNSDVDFAIQPLNNGSFRSLVNIKNNNAQKKYEFPIDLKDGSKLVYAKDYLKENYTNINPKLIQESKEILVVDSNNNIETVFMAAWAKDSNGQPVNSYYKINGNKLVQYVDFDKNTAFPVVADPLPLVLAGVAGGTVISLGVLLDISISVCAAYVVYYGITKAIKVLKAELNDKNTKKHKKRKKTESAKAAAKDIPSWAKGEAPYVGESGKKFAERLCNNKYGPGKYKKGPSSEYNKLRKYGDRAF